MISYFESRQVETTRYRVELADGWTEADFLAGIESGELMAKLEGPVGVNRKTVFVRMKPDRTEGETVAEIKASISWNSGIKFKSIWSLKMSNDPRGRPRGRKLDDATSKLMLRMIGDGQPITMVARSIGISPSTVHRYAREHCTCPVPGRVDSRCEWCQMRDEKK